MAMVGVTYSGSDQQEPWTMEIRSILLGMSLSTMSPSFVAMGADLAQRFQADLNGFAAADVPVEPIVAEWTAALSERYDEERRRVEEALETGEMVFTKGITGSSGHSWRSLITRPTPVLINAARRNDLIVVGAASVADHRPASEIDAGELILSAGRPVLVVAQDASRVAANKVLVAWKDTREARRAISDALPFLRGASDILVATVQEGDYGTERESLADVVAWLNSHEIKARSDVLPLGGSAGTTLKNSAASMGADLIVSGGYGHMRLREWLFGGATLDLLGDPTISHLFSN